MADIAIALGAAASSTYGSLAMVLVALLPMLTYPLWADKFADSGGTADE